MRLILVGMSLLLYGCGKEEEPISPLWKEPVPDACGSGGTLSLIPLDVWGRDLDQATISLNYSPKLVGMPVGEGAISFFVGEEAIDLNVVATDSDHLDFGLSLRLSPRLAMPIQVASLTEGARVAWSTQLREVNGVDCPNVSLFFGMDTPFFSAAAAAPTKNKLSFLINGESFWWNVAQDIKNTKERVTWSTWLWESDFELIRPADHMTLSESERRKNTLLYLLEAQSGVDIRVLSNLFVNVDILDWFYLDEELVDRGERANDGFEVILEYNDTYLDYYAPYTGKPAPWSFAERVEDNPRFADLGVNEQVATDLTGLELQAASHHQKAMVFDGEVAYVGGFNSKGSDWDSSNHWVFDHRRMEFEATESKREAVYYGEAAPDHLPRRDYGVRIEGPAVTDVERVLKTRWDHARSNGEKFSENSTAFSLDDPPKEKKRGSLTQITSTLPQPYSQQQVLEAQQKAFAQAEDYIYIEDQYFRSPILLQTIFQRMLEVPDLHLFVITNAIENENPGLKWTYLADQIMRGYFPDRYVALQARSFDVYIEEGTVWDDVDPYDIAISNHAKLRIVDDKYISIGSSNFNNRSMLYDSEMNVEILDEDLATPVREAVFENLVGQYWKGWLSNDAANNMAVMKSAAEWNEEVVTWWLDNAASLSAAEAWEAAQTAWPDGFLHPLSFSSNYWWDAGPDLF
jgi:phosphatidylserine/phosphatidylglycerophosphate/cardiolipin synthase-like enzyme